jgi:acetyl-CoA carboxylase carboxyl transferase subunit alpha
MPHPEGYRKALRLMKQAEKFARPILFFIDTPGAFPGLGAEERGQGQAIALNLFEMIDLKVPLIAVVVSEGGSGGALAIGVTDRIYMFENSIYSIISPEGFASILFKDSAQAKKAASLMKLTAQDLLEFGIIDTILPEVDGGMQENMTFSLDALRQALKKDLKVLSHFDIDKLLIQRYKKYRSLGVYEDKALIEKESK